MTRFVINEDGKFVFSSSGKFITLDRCLPDTVTVTLSGFAAAFPDRSEINLQFASCFGSGAAGHVAAPAPDEAAGAVSDPIITAGGSGYAVLGRIEPNVMLFVVGPGSGAELTPTLVESADACDRPIWVVDSVTIDAAGTGYDDSTYVDVQVGNFPAYKATPSSVTGTGARIRVVWVDNSGEWEVGSIEILDPGSGYTVNDTFAVVTGLVLTVTAVDGGGAITAMSDTQTEVFPVLGTFGSPTITPVLPRLQPTLTLYDNGAGASLTVNTGVLSGSPPLTWEITSVTVVDGGDDEYWTDYDNIYVEEDPDNSGEGSETLLVRTNKSEPSYTFSGGNDDAVLDLTYTASGYGAPNETWYLSSVAVTSGGTGYTDGAYLSVSPTDFYRDIDLSTPSLQVRTVRAEPEMHTTPDSVTGSGADISLTATQGTDFEGRDSWSATGTSIDSAGSGYTVGDTFLIESNDGYTLSTGIVEVTSVGGSGEITGVSITDGGEFFLDTGVIEEVVVDWPGEGYHDDGSIHSIEVVSGGEFWENGDSIDSVTIDDAGEMYTEDPSEPAIVADVTVTVNDTRPTPGTGATLTVDIETDTGDPQFGQITGATVTVGGSGYNGVIWIKRCCGETYDGRSFVLKRSEGLCKTSTFSRGPENSIMRKQPTLVATPLTVTGTDAVLSVSSTYVTYAPEWMATGAAVVTPGTGYSVDDEFDIEAPGGVVVYPGRVRVASVDGGGGITSVALLSVSPSVDIYGGVGRFYEDVAFDDFHEGQAVCYMEHRFCTPNTNSNIRGAIYILWRGADLPPIVVVESELVGGSSSSESFGTNQLCYVQMESTTLLAKDDPFEFTAEAPSGATATVVEGGVYDPEDGYAGVGSCHPCCNGAEALPTEITLEWTRTIGADYRLTLRPTAAVAIPDTADYVCVRSGHSWYWNGSYPPGIGVIVVPCRTTQTGSKFVPLNDLDRLEYLVEALVDAPGNFNASGELDIIDEDEAVCNDCDGCMVIPYFFMDIFGDGPVNPVYVQPGNTCAAICLPKPICKPTGPWDIWAWCYDSTIEGALDAEWRKIGEINVA